MRKGTSNNRSRSWMISINLVLVVLLLAACGSTTSTGPTPTPTPSFAMQANAFFNQQVAKHAFSGTVQVTQDGKVLFSKSYSMADWEQQVPNTLNTKFRIGSVTKQFTALAILLLQEQGKLHVQDHLCAYIARCPAAWQPITLQQLLTHTSGLPMISTVPKPFPATPEEVIALFDHLPLNFAPGTHYRYSNEGYQVLGYVIQRVSGQSYASFIEQHILAPLHMRDSGFMLPTGQRIAQGYQAWQIKADTTIYDRPLPANMTFLYANGYLYSTVGDVQRWNQSLTTPTLVSQQSLKAMFTPYVAMPSYSDLYSGSHYGYGWVIDQEGSLRVIWHNGWINGYRAYNGWYPDQKTTIIILDNLDTADPVPIASTLESMLFRNK
jgi:CubicO group peptidase (beta-lactamase class C family)